ncbi:MAG: hypothetical protein V3W34_02970 [Phycisphaerae bacterium]
MCCRTRNRTRGTKGRRDEGTEANNPQSAIPGGRHEGEPPIVNCQLSIDDTPKVVFQLENN